MYIRNVRSFAAAYVDAFIVCSESKRLPDPGSCIMQFCDIDNEFTLF